MLTLKKKRRDQKIDLVLREKKPLITKTLLNAFAIAFFFHLGLLFLFRVAPLAPNPSEILFPPVNVQTDLSSLSNQIEEAGAFADLESKSHAFLYPPPLSKPEITASMTRFVAQPDFFSESMGAKSLGNLSKPLVEELLFDSSSHPLETFLSVYGELTNRPYQLQLDLKSLDPIEALYYVQVDNRTGKIFMSEKLYPNEMKRKKKQEEKVLKSLRFKPDEKSWISEGYVEIRKS